MEEGGVGGLENTRKIFDYVDNGLPDVSLDECQTEPIAFMGGVFAGLLRLDLNEDPLKEWVTKTVEASGITAEEIQATEIESEETPQQIEIE
nr:UPF0426 protein At1g28150, chloroplastic [Ipomoea batatas]